MFRYEYLLTMIYVFLIDIMWIWYFKFSTDRRPVLAGISASLLYLLSAYAYIYIINDTHNLIPAIIGSFLGTFVAVKYNIEKPIDFLMEKWYSDIKRKNDATTINKR